MNDKDKNLNIDKLDEIEPNTNEKLELKEDDKVDLDKKTELDNSEDVETVNDDIDTVNPEVKNNNSKKKMILGGCALAIGLGALSLTQLSNNKYEDEFEDFIVSDSEAVDLEFTIKDGDSIRNRTPQEMREFYTPEGEEFIKTLYPDTSDSDLALVTIGKSISKELSDIEFITTNNEKVKLKNLKGKRVILDFALTTCPSCQEEFTYLSTRDTSENEVFLHLFPRNSTEEIKQIYKDLNIEFSSSHTISSTGMNNLSFEDFNITHVPTKIYINEEGIVTYVTTNTLSDNETYELHYDRAFGEGEKVLDFLKTN